ncbi:MAG: Glu-tRNA(Gln) amidotransferase subunit GatD [Nanoarchaeota archaeon]|nr:Glu-tRNA(Gln) amidotransferase subunit GatD [Nanoarchaeota archaeon]
MEKVKEGDTVEVVSDKNFKGILMPSKDKNIINLKLSSGYNIGIKSSNIKKINLIKKQIQKKKINKEIKQNKNLPTISILHCGGTLASKISYETGAVSAKFSPEDILEMFPELQNLANINSKLVYNILSENIRFKHYNLIAKEIEKELKNKPKGIIITHGTDTLAYTSSALSFILEDLPIPVILVGSQRSSDRASSDSFLNLICATQFILNSDFGDVAICMHASMNDDKCFILPANKTKKLHSSRRDAFKPVNVNPYATVDKQGNIKFLTEYKKVSDSKLKLKPFKDVKVGILKAHPNLTKEEILQYKNYKGLVIEGTGLGHLSVESFDEYSKENEKVFNALKSLKIPIVMTTQTIFGNINLNVYSTGRLLKPFVQGNLTDMLTETAFIKLAWLLSNYPKKVKELITKNLRGEITNRILAKEDFLN